MRILRDLHEMLRVRYRILIVHFRNGRFITY